MRLSNLNTILALGLISALAFSPVSQAGEKKVRGTTNTANHEIRETVEFTFQKIEMKYNPKELTIQKSVPWQQRESTATQVRKAVDRVLKRGAQPRSGDVALESITLAHEGFERK